MMFLIIVCAVCSFITMTLSMIMFVDMFFEHKELMERKRREMMREEFRKLMEGD